MNISISIQVRTDDAGLPALWLIVSSEGQELISQPYDPTTQISHLFAACKGKLKQEPVKIPFGPFPPVPSGAPIVRLVVEGEKPRRDPNAIEKRDIVELSAAIAAKDIDDDSEIKHGIQYRVMDVRRKANGRGEMMVMAYDIINDASPSPIRLSVPANYMRLVRKAEPITVIKNMNFETLHKCAECGEENALELDEPAGKYVGQCAKCAIPLELARA